MNVDRLGRWAQPVRILLAFAGFLLFWELLVRFTGIKPYILPAPSEIALAMAAKMPRLARAAAYTVQPMLLGFIAAVVLGVAIALGIAFSRRIEGVVYPLLVFFQIIPKIAVAPLFIIWFGFGLAPKVLLVFLLSFFPVVVSAITAFRSVDADIMDLARSTGAADAAHVSGRCSCRTRCRRCSPASRWLPRCRRPPRWSPSSSRRTRARLPAARALNNVSTRR